MPADDARDGGEAQTAAGEFGGEEGIEDAARVCSMPQPVSRTSKQT